MEVRLSTTSQLQSIHRAIAVIPCSLLTLIVNTTTGDVTDKNNYRPIVIATSISKVKELLILSKTEETWNRHAHRRLPQDIAYYKHNSSPVCIICYLHATMAFDRVNHWLLLKKLLDRFWTATCRYILIIIILKLCFRHIYGP